MCEALWGGMIDRRAAAAALVLIAVATAFPADADPGRGAAIYQRVCSACHGERGDGRSLAAGALRNAPRDFTTEQAREALSREYMIAIVRDGRPHTPMVGRTERLGQADIEAAVDFIRAAFIPPEPGSPLAAGRSAYRRACAGCHGERGQGGPARAGLPAAPPIAAALAAPGFADERVRRASVREPHVPGARVEGLPLSGEEADAVAGYVRSAFIESAPGRRGATR